MKTQRVAALAAAVIVIGCDSGKSQATVSSAGTSRITLPPSWATMSVDVESRAATPSEASNLNSRRSRAVLQALSARRLVDSIVVADVSLYGSTDERSRSNGFRASTDITFQTRQLDSLGVILEVALAAGATRIGGIEFQADSMEATRQRALAIAFDDARRDAATLAQASGHRLGGLIAQSTATDLPQSAEGYEYVSFGNAVSGSFTLQPGVISMGPTPHGVTVTAKASGRWELAD